VCVCVCVCMCVCGKSEGECSAYLVSFHSQRQRSYPEMSGLATHSWASRMPTCVSWPGHRWTVALWT